MLTSLPLKPVRDRRTTNRPMFAGASIFVNGSDPLPSRTRPVAVTAPETYAPAAAFLSAGNHSAWNGVGHGFPAGVAEGDRRSATEQRHRSTASSALTAREVGDVSRPHPGHTGT